MTRLISLITGVLIAAAMTVTFSPQSHAEDVRFWGYWQAKGAKWVFAPKGPAQLKPKDGTVEGWRFAKSGGDTGTPPTAKPSFAKICGSTEPVRGSKRVAVVIDPGTTADAPKGVQPVQAESKCAVVGEKASGSDVLAKVAKPQVASSGLVCEINSYPAGACKTGTKPSKAPANAAGKKKEEDDDSNTGLYVGAGVVLLVAAAGGFAVLRRKQAR